MIKLFGPDHVFFIYDPPRSDWIGVWLEVEGDYAELMEDDWVYWDSYVPGVTPIFDQVLFEFWDDEAWG